MRPRIQIGFVLLPVTYIILLCVELFGCHPFQKHWQIYPDPGGKPALFTLYCFEFVLIVYSRLLPLAFYAQPIYYDNL